MIFEDLELLQRHMNKIKLKVKVITEEYTTERQVWIVTDDEKETKVTRIGSWFQNPIGIAEGLVLSYNSNSRFIIPLQH